MGAIFTELFFGDAEKSRAPVGHHADHARARPQASSIPMAGRTFHALKIHIWAALDQDGESVAIREQVGEIGVGKGPAERKVAWSRPAH